MNPVIPKSIRTHKKRWLTAALFLCVLFLSQCIDQKKEPVDARGEGYIGASACISCHKDVYQAYVSTAHYHTSSPASATTIKGSFEHGRNEFVYTDQLKVLMEKQGGHFFQTAYVNGRKTESHPFDLVFGSGRKAQTYMYFDSATIFQLPVSYFVPEQTWANSPRYPSDHIKFDRIIPSGCFGCHSSMISVKQSYKGFQLYEGFEKNSIIYGIDCERCHGPAAAHVAFQEEHPEEKTAKFITPIRNLNREQKLDMCAICHSGVKDAQQSVFNFKPGNSLADFYYPSYKKPDLSTMDVHGNQYQLMVGSPCFLKTTTLTCSSCHNVHKNESADLSGFSKRCMDCHKNTRHDFVDTDPEMKDAVARNCIDCHMPLKPSSVITLLTGQKKSPTPDMIRTHLIGIYPEETQRILQSIKNAVSGPHASASTQ